MVKKKKIEEEIESEEYSSDDETFDSEETEEQIEQEEELQSSDDYSEIEQELLSDMNQPDDGFGEQTFNTAMQVGGDLHKQSKIIDEFTQLKKEVKYSFFDKYDKMNIHLRSKTYQSVIYIKKVMDIAQQELLAKHEVKRNFFEIDTLEDLKEYFEENGRPYLYNQKIIDNWDSLHRQMVEIRDSKYLDIIYNDKQTEISALFKSTSNARDYVDDLGLLSDIYTTTEASKGLKGNEREAMNTTININRESNERREQDEANPENRFSKIFRNFASAPKKKDDDFY